MESLQKLLDIMSTLRDPEKGCPWDREQNFITIAPYTIEEAYEVADAIERDDKEDLCSELGDLLFQVVYHARMAEEEGSFDFVQVVEKLNLKLERRHPHVFGKDNASKKFTTELATLGQAWELQKKREREARTEGEENTRLLDAISRNIPALQRAQKLQIRAASIGFDWDSIQPVLDKVTEELDEVKQTLGTLNNQEKQQEEIGDLLFACVNLARHIGINAESALRSANHKFEHRFNFIEKVLHADGQDLETVSLEQMDDLWEQAKKQGR